MAEREEETEWREGKKRANGGKGGRGLVEEREEESE